MTKFFQQNFERILHKKDLKNKQEISKFKSRMKEAVENEKRNKDIARERELLIQEVSNERGNYRNKLDSKEKEI
jgi:hypothetical protein